MIKVSFDGTDLTDSTIEGVQGLRVNGRQVNQAQSGLRATEMAFQPRGNRSVSIAFRVARIFSTLNDAEEFAHDHFGDMSPSGDLAFTLSGGGSRTYADAVLDACEPELAGLTVFVSYQFSAPLPS